jgi:hypothetical protein
MYTMNIYSCQRMSMSAPPLSVKGTVLSKITRGCILAQWVTPYSVSVNSSVPAM